MGEQCYDKYIDALASAEPAARLVARDGLVSVAVERIRAVAHRMVRGFPQVRRWDETDDIVQGAALRLTRALDSVVPSDARHLLGLIAMQVRRELLDLARRYGGPESFARHHETNAANIEGHQVQRSDAAVDPVEVDFEGINSWTRFHEVANALDDEGRELFNLVWYLGLSKDEAAKALGCSVRTIARRWDVVKQRLLVQLKGQAPA